MHIITADTKISALIKADSAVIDVIASINNHFNKLRNPVLRKVLASRVTIAEAARIGKVDISTFFERLLPLGFVVQDTGAAETRTEESVTVKKYQKKLDVRVDIASGKDPFRKIMSEIGLLNSGDTLLLVNSFEPVPLIRILKEKQFLISVKETGDSEVHTYITKGAIPDLNCNDSSAGNFEKLLEQFEGSLVPVDVRSLPMPQPMHTILSALELLRDGEALFVHHKKVPMFLLPELKKKGFSYVYRHVDDGVQLLIYREPT